MGISLLSCKYENGFEDRVYIYKRILLTLATDAGKPTQVQLSMLVISSEHGENGFLLAVTYVISCLNRMKKL